MKKALLFFGTLLLSSLNAQTDLRVLEAEGSLLTDINDSGKATHRASFYDYATNTSVSAGDNITSTYRLNNAGDVAGAHQIFTTDGFDIDEAAYMKNGVWYNIGFFPGTIPKNSWFGTGLAISPNSKYITGQITTSDTRSYPYIYNTETKTLTKISDGDNLWLYGRGEGINDSGYVVGFADREDIFDMGTFWVPAYWDPTGAIHYIDFNIPETGEASDINNAGIIVGYKGSKAFTYNVNTNEYKYFQSTAKIMDPVFTSISDNGLILGYCGTNGSRDAIVYHDGLLAPMLLSDYLKSKGVDITTFDGKLGTGMGVSPNGRYLSGFDNDHPAFAKGWVVRLDSLPYGPGCLEAPNGMYPSTVFIPTCSGSTETITTNAKTGEYSLVKLSPTKEYTFSSSISTDFITILDETGHVILAHGKGSVKYFNKNEQTIRFSVNLNEQCGYSNEVRTKFVVCSTPLGCEWTVRVTGPGTQGDEVSWYLKNTAGQMLLIGNNYSYGYDDTQTIYAEGPLEFYIEAKGDFNDNTPSYSVSNGTTVVAQGQLNGGDEVTKTNLNCASMAVEQVTTSKLQFYPNPVIDILKVSGAQEIITIDIFSTDGKLVKANQKINAKNGEINLSNLSSGLYIVKAKMKDGSTQTMKVLKK